MKKILITGGSGFIGASLVKKYLNAGYSVRVLDNNSRGNVRRLKDCIDDIEFIQGDVRDYEVVRNASKGMNAVAHLAFVNGTEFFYNQPKLVLEVGVKGALYTLDAAIAEGVEEYYLMSSSEVYQTPKIVPTDESAAFYFPDPLNPRYSYGGGKAISELLAINYSREHFERMVIVRPHNVYGPDMGWEHVVPQFVLRASDLVDSNPAGVVDFEIQGDGSQTRSFVYIDDFTDGCFLAFDKGEDMNIYHVGTHDEISIKTLAEMVVSQFGSDCRIVTGEEVKGGTNRRCPDVTKVMGLGYNPNVGLAEGLKLSKEWYVANKHLAV